MPINHKPISQQHLHIVCLDVPYPPDYGGVFDLFYKIKALHQLGIKIHLHCFEYGRGRQPELNKYCEEVHYYKRQKLSAIKLRIPYIVSSRINRLLIQNLLKDDHPVLLEGVHCTYYLYNGALSNRKVLVRLHNVEYKYYKELARATNSFLKKLYFNIESRRLKKYENEIATKAQFIAVNEIDKRFYEQHFSADHIEVLPVFLPFTGVTSKEGKGTFCLYHGNLSVVENENVVFWLLENVFSRLDFKFIIAGKNPSASLQKQIAQHKNATLVSNPSKEIMDEYIQNAHVQILPSFNATGIKIKLLNGLFNGRFVVANVAAVEGTGLQPLCTIAETPTEYIHTIQQLWQQAFAQADIKKRSAMITSLYNNQTNAARLIEWIS